MFASRAEADLALFEYLDGFYNPRRIQERLGYLSPIEFEEKHYADRAMAEPVNLKPRQPALTSWSATPAQRGKLRKPGSSPSCCVPARTPRRQP
ncbi:IS3 family transposase [Streptomyces sp. NPDC058625]|uniref:IS3 family transposase n=1 Tax=Streptomyces sp. NPDC058625 TaxID=3346564 RepID=UPI003667A738